MEWEIEGYNAQRTREEYVGFYWSKCVEVFKYLQMQNIPKIHFHNCDKYKQILHLIAFVCVFLFGNV